MINRYFNKSNIYWINFIRIIVYKKIKIKYKINFKIKIRIIIGKDNNKIIFRFINNGSSSSNNNYNNNKINRISLVWINKINRI
jgi:hypothetical protein